MQLLLLLQNSCVIILQRGEVFVIGHEEAEALREAGQKLGRKQGRARLFLVHQGQVALVVPGPQQRSGVALGPGVVRTGEGEFALFVQLPRQLLQSPGMAVDAAAVPLHGGGPGHVIAHAVAPRIRPDLEPGSGPGLPLHRVRGRPQGEPEMILVGPQAVAAALVPVDAGHVGPQGELGRVFVTAKRKA